MSIKIQDFSLYCLLSQRLGQSRIDPHTRILVRISEEEDKPQCVFKFKELINRVKI